MKLSSPAFSHGAPIPRTFTCQGSGISPPLEWSQVPENARSLVLIVDDPDSPDPAAPKTPYPHWLLYALPPRDAKLPENVSSNELPAGALQGLNGWNRIGWGGPCPRIGRHRYFFRLHALDIELQGLGAPDRQRLLDAIAGHVIETAEWMGTYEKTDEP